MVARAHAFTIDGLRTEHVSVEVDVRPGLPGFAIVGLGDKAVREARERIQAAVRNAGFEFPARRVTANLAPGDIPKAGAGLDLALACALLAASGQIPCERLERIALCGELGLDGRVRASRGTLAIAHAARGAGLDTLVLAAEHAHEGQLIEGLEVTVVEHLRSAARVLAGGRGDPLPPAARRLRSGAGRPGGPDLSDVRGQQHAVRALVIAAAGAHNCLLSGPPGTGKTMLAQRLPSILPPLEPHEALEVTRIHSLAGARVRGLLRARPFRAPHHSVTAAGLLGGARRGRVGEVVLAHNGVLFLDELSEFARSTLDALRQPLEDGRVAIVRAHNCALYPARFMLIAATNPCPCGYAGVLERCGCSEAELARHRRRLSGPLLDRIDMLVSVAQETPGPHPTAISSARAREQVIEARARQRRRMRGERVSANAQIDARMLREHARLGPRGERLLQDAGERGLLSTRGVDRTLRVARTIADLDASERIRARDVGAALALRPWLARGGDRAAAA